VRDALLPAEAATDCPGWTTPTNVLRGNVLDERIVMDTINRAKRRFFLRPSYMARYVGDVARIAFTKQKIVAQVMSRTVFGARVVDTSKTVPGSASTRPFGS
jgi:hypothetical protein